MKKTLTGLALSLMITSSFVSYAGQEGGGGDATEIRVNEIRSDILNWIERGGAKNLDYTMQSSYEEYVSKMSAILQPKKVVIGFVENDNSTDDEQRVSVDGVQKTCRGFVSSKDSRPHILCNISRFERTSDEKQYELIHHEYAGLVEVEKNDGASSDYYFSSQLTAFLESQVVKKLSIKKAAPKPALIKMEVFSLSPLAHIPDVSDSELENNAEDYDSFFEKELDANYSFINVNGKTSFEPVIVSGSFKVGWHVVSPKEYYKVIVTANNKVIKNSIYRAPLKKKCSILFCQPLYLADKQVEIKL